MPGDHMKRFVLFLLLTLSWVVSPGAIEAERGIASWYGPGFHGRKTANGETYNMYEMTAAHKALPFNTRVKVIDLETGRSVIVRINDRGPFVAGRIIDLSYAAARALGMEKKGTAHVELQVIFGNDSRKPGQSGYYYIQVGIFSKKANAIRQMNDVWRSTGFKPHILVSGDVYRLLVGPWEEKVEAEKVLVRMKRKGIDGIIYNGSLDR
ncbi:MAG TPA: septal ring lytic transglycosylase RlpA family protein [Firmicutes bacterium]|nr:septal ring lytic transglycosylase RlpA family protein [Bacillota bacterium]